MVEAGGRWSLQCGAESGADLDFERGQMHIDWVFLSSFTGRGSSATSQAESMQGSCYTHLHPPTS